MKYDEDDYTVMWSDEFATLEEVKASGLIKGRLPAMGPDGFFKNANTGVRPMSRGELRHAQSAKKTANMRTPLKNVGDKTNRVYPFYDDVTDPSTLHFVIKVLTRIR